MKITKKPAGKPNSKTMKTIKKSSNSPIKKLKPMIKNESNENIERKKPKFEDGKKPIKDRKSNFSANNQNGKPNFNQKSKFNQNGKPGENTPLEKPNWQEFKKDKKDLKMKRKESREKDLFKVNIEAKKLYEQLKCKTSKDKSELAENLYNLIKRANGVQKFVLAHDTSRIIQCLLKRLSPKLREELSKELLPISVAMAQSRYAHFCILRMLKYGSNSIKSSLVDSFMGSILKLVNHNISSKILDMLYFNVANKKQKVYMRQEFYSDLYTNTKDVNIGKLSDTYKDSPNMKNGLLAAVKSKLEHIANKNMAENSVVHAVLLEYLHEYIGEDEIAEDCLEIIRIYSTLIPNLVTTRDGCQSATWCFWLSPTKERRAIVKSLKEHLEKIIVHEHGHVFISAIVNTMDDTKAIKKVLFDPILGKLEEVVANQWGRKLVEWFISPGDRKCFHPELSKFLDSGLKYSKKDKPLRVQEIFEQIEGPICDAICTNPKFWISTGHIGLLTATIIKRITPINSKRVFDSLAESICDLEWKIAATEPNGSEIVGIEDSGMHIVLKKILKSDEERNTKGELSFCNSLINVLNNEIIEHWIKFNRGCFILLVMYENSLEEIQVRLKVLLQNFSNELNKSTGSGGKLLAKKLKL